MPGFIHSFIQSINQSEMKEEEEEEEEEEHDKEDKERRTLNLTSVSHSL
jgi:hypothetical protein